MFETSLESIMKTKIIAAVLVAASAAFAAPAFASGYGPAPFYRPNIGAPASQHGQSEQTIAAERAAINTDTAYGGVKSESSAYGVRSDFANTGSLFRHH
jgi:hypothetical protein